MIMSEEKKIKNGLKTFILLDVGKRHLFWQFWDCSGCFVKWGEEKKGCL